MRSLVIAAEHRGHDATGFVAQTEPLDRPLGGTVIVAKGPTPASHFIQTDAAFRRLRHQRCAAFIGHVRTATHGDPADNINNHPFASRDQRLFLVHNGVVSNHADLTDKFSLKLESDCDSEVLLRMIAASSDVPTGLRTCLREVQGSMAVALYDRQRGVVWLARNHGRPLWLARLRNDRRFFFASTPNILLDAFKQVVGANVPNRVEMLVPVAENAPVVISPTGRIVSP